MTDTVSFTDPNAARLKPQPKHELLRITMSPTHIAEACINWARLRTGELPSLTTAEAVGVGPAPINVIFTKKRVRTKKGAA